MLAACAIQESPLRSSTDWRGGAGRGGVLDLVDVAATPRTMASSAGGLGSIPSSLRPQGRAEEGSGRVEVGRLTLRWLPRVLAACPCPVSLRIGGGAGA